MIIESIQRVFELTPLARRQTVYTTEIDPSSGRRTTEAVEYIIYNRRGEIETNPTHALDLRA